MKSKKFNQRLRIGSRKMIDLFLQGLLYTAPIGLTVYFLWVIFDFFDSRVQAVFISLFNHTIPGLGIIAFFLFISLLGWIFPKLFTRPAIIFFEKLLSKVPMIEMVYSSIKDFISAFIGKE